MITYEDLQQAITECQAEREPNSNTCIKLAAFLTIREILFSDKQPSGGYSYDAPPPDVSRETLSEFMAAVSRADKNEVWAVMDELMNTLHLINPRLYDGVMKKIS